nr:MAG TPA: tail protein [Caudoviricetes sp.]
MNLFVLDRSMKAVQSVSTDTNNSFWFDDSGSGGQKITLVSGCVVGSYTFTIDSSSKESIYFQPGNYIVFKDKYNIVRMYTIMSLNGEDELTIETEDCGLDLLNHLVGSWSSKGHSTKIEDIVKSTLYGTGWSYELHNDNLAARDLNLEAKIIEYSGTDTVLKRLQDICASYNVEMYFDIKFDGLKVIKQTVHILDSITQNKHISKRYINDIDLISTTVDKSIKNLYTAVRPINGGVTIEPIVYDDGDFFTKKGDQYIYARTANKLWSRFKPINDSITDFDGYIYSEYSGNSDNPEALFEEGLANLKENSIIQLSYQAKVVDMNAQLGDYIQLVDKNKKDAVYLTARVTEVINHYTNSYDDECTISNYSLLKPKPSSDIQNIVNEIKKITLMKIKPDKIDYAINDDPNNPPLDDEWYDINHLPVLSSGQYQWTRRIEYYSDGSEVKSYNIAKSPTVVIPKIIKTEYLYQIGQNGTEIPSGEWLTTRPESNGSTYIWTKIIDTYDNEAKITKYLVVKDGSIGKNGRSIVKQTHQYYLSTSNTSIEGGKWLDDIIPVLKVSTYIWKRLYTKYDDNTEVVSDPEIDDFHNNQYNTIINLENKVVSNNTLYEQQLSKIEKLEKVADEYKDISTKVNTITHTYENSINTFTNELNGVKKITGKITSSEDGIKIEKPDDPSGLANQLGSRGFEVTKPSATGNARTTVLKADEYGVYASSFKAVDSMSFGAHRAELYIVNEVDGELNVDGTGYFWIGDVI